jgi:hypothetical protein
MHERFTMTAGGAISIAAGRRRLRRDAAGPFSRRIREVHAGPQQRCPC